MHANGSCLTHLVNKVADLVRVGRAWTILWGGHERWDNIIAGDLRAGIEATVQLAQIIVLERGKAESGKEA